MKIIKFESHDKNLDHYYENIMKERDFIIYITNHPDFEYRIVDII